MRLPEIIFQRIPPAVLERVVYDQGRIERARFESLFKASGLSPQQIAEQVVEAYKNQTAKLAYGLYEQVNETDWKTARDLYEHFSKSPEFEYDNHQASLVGRYPTLLMEGLSEFLRSVKRQVCLIVCRNGNNGRVVRGTGFLVGPDLVLTCRHVLPGFVAGQNFAQNGSAVELYFDFFYGDPVDSLSPNLPEARKVSLDSNWHIASCDEAVPDGLVGVLSEPEIQRISQALDFVLLRLNTPIGSQPLQKAGGRRRGWIALPQGNVTLPQEAWIILPQHPNGWAQRIDLGRFAEFDQTATRIRYTANAAQGSSGAPCFNHNFVLVGIHNAYVGPHDHPVANQAIRFDCIAPTVRQHVAATGNLSYALRWSISRNEEKPEVILGREKLLNWLRDSAGVNPRNLTERVYAAQADMPGAGCSFSIDILHAEIRDSNAPRAVYGQQGQQLAANAEDFLLSLLRELGIETSKFDEADRMPVRPTGSGANDPMVGEIDKLERWLSDELPNWVGNIIAKHLEKKTDVRDFAKATMEYYRKLNQPAPAEVENNANAPEPVYVRQNSWNLAYVVIDDLRSSAYSGNGPRTEMKGEVQSLIAALVKGKPEDTIHPGLRRLRWMFLGYLPDFVSADPIEGSAVTIEVLEPTKVGKPELAATVNRIWEALRPNEPLPLAGAGVLASSVLRAAGAVLGNGSRLAVLQREANKYVLDVLEEAESLK